MGPGEFLNINFFTALFTLANTVALFLVLKKFLFKPVMKMIEDRQKEIDDMYSEADQAKQEASNLRSEYEQKLSVAAQTSERMVKEAVERGQHREEDIIRQANAEADAIRRKAQADIAQEKKKALNDAKNEIADLAMDIAGKVVGHSLTNQDQGKLVDRFIEELGEGL
ncbi:MAG: F0F1 ATP synthase subunit B [Oscillospiraceae bacterium]|nr:F0F1 ATP synthase subunit B [Oscillospiraceae bacterium]